jgi:hypothetical protein
MLVRKPTPEEIKTAHSWGTWSKLNDAICFRMFVKFEFRLF